MGSRTKMSREDRAKQFMPFAALKGYPDALRKKEKIVVPKIELSEDYAEELDRKLNLIRPGDIVTVVYFFKDEYLKLTGIVAKLNRDGRFIQIVGTRIPLADVYDITSEAMD